jgi:secreted trypsin-like serine protease
MRAIVERSFAKLIVALTILCGCGQAPSPDENARGDEIINGTVPPIGVRPWLAQIGSSFEPHSCGGSLLAPDWVLTAAHCVVGYDTSDFTIVLGEHDRSTLDGFEQLSAIDYVVVHPDYGAGPLPVDHNDVALIHLASPVTLNSRVQVIRPAIGDDGPGSTATVSGWGWTAPFGSPSTILMETSLPIEASSTCDAAPELHRDLFPDELCAGYPDFQGGACHTDSGGPLAVQRPGGTWELVGVVSWGQDTICGTYTVFARVTSHIGWIRQYVVDEALLLALDLL